MSTTRQRTSPAEPATTANEHPERAANHGRTIVRRIGFGALAIAVLSLALQLLRPKLDPTSSSQRDIAGFIDEWSDTGLWLGVTIGLLTTLASLLWQVRRSRNNRNSGIAETIAKALRIDPHNLHVQVKWRRNQLVSGTIRVPKRVGFARPPSETLPIALKDHLAGPVTVHLNPGKGRITFGPHPPEPETDESDWWDIHPQLAKAHTALAPLLPELAIDQAQTQLANDGTPTTITLRYGATQRDFNHAFRRKVRNTLENKVHSPTGRWVIHWNSSDHAAVVEQAPAMPEHVLNPGPGTPEDWPTHTLPLGVAEDGQHGCWNPLKFPHMLIAAATGGGKTALLRTLLVTALILKWQVYICDGKLASFRPGFAHGWGLTHEHIATRGHTMEAMILAIHQELTRRYKAVEQGRASAKHYVPLLLLCDENSEIIPMMNAHAKAQWAENNPGKAVPKSVTSDAVDALWAIARLGRQVGVYIVLAHQRPDVSYVPGEARDNLMTKWAAGWLSPAGLKMLFDSYSIEQRITAPKGQTPAGEPRMENVSGRGTANLGQGPEPIQTWYTPDPNPIEADDLTDDERHTLDRLRALAAQAQQEAGWPLLDGVLPYEEDDTDTANAEPQQAVKLAAAQPGGSGHTDDASNDGARTVDAHDPTRGGEQVPAIALSEGETVLIDIDGEQVPAIITELVDDPDDPSAIVIDYTIAAPDRQDTGQAGQLSIDADDDIWRI